MAPVFLFLIVTSTLVAFATGKMEPLTRASLDAAKSAVDISLGLVGTMALFLGLVEVVKRGGLMTALARGLRPMFNRLMPGVPDGHPALGMITLNIAANMLGLGNAATPFGVDAMRQLDGLNGDKGTATDAMCLFLAINTSSVTLLPLGVISVRASLASHDPASIVSTSLIATAFSTSVAILSTLLLSRLPLFRASRPAAISAVGETPAPETHANGSRGTPRWIRHRVTVSALILLAAIIGATVSLSSNTTHAETGVAARHAASWLPLPLLILLAVLYGWSRGVNVYEGVVEGAKEGFQIALLIIPYLVAILVAVGMFRASGSLDWLTSLFAPITVPLGFPAEALPMALMRPLSGSGALGIMTETMHTHGPDSFVGYLVSTLNGSTETTFYVLAVYGGAVGLRRTRHALPSCLTADLSGIVAATAACHLVFG